MDQIADQAADRLHQVFEHMSREVTDYGQFLRRELDNPEDPAEVIATITKTQQHCKRILPLADEALDLIQLLGPLQQ